MCIYYEGNCTSRGPHQVLVLVLYLYMQHMYSRVKSRIKNKKKSLRLRFIKTNIVRVEGSNSDHFNLFIVICNLCVACVWITGTLGSTSALSNSNKVTCFGYCVLRYWYQYYFSIRSFVVVFFFFIIFIVIFQHTNNLAKCFLILGR